MAVGIVIGLIAGSAAIHADTNTDFGIKVVLPPELSARSVTNSPEATVRANFRRRLHAKIPLANEGYSMSTLGQLVKLCAAAVVGHVQEIKDVTADDKRSSLSREYLLTVSVVSNLLEGQVSSPLSVKFHQWTWKIDVKPEDDIILFLSPDELIFEWGIFDFDFEKQRSAQNRPFSVLGESRGVLVLGKPRDDDDIFNVIKQYIELLRKSRRNPDAYYEFLKKTVQSQNERIKRDGNSDLLYFLRSCTTFDLNQVLADNDVENNMKEYVRLVVIPDREKKSP